MIMRTRIRMVIATTALAAVALFGMAACGGSPASASGSLSPEQSALTALGFTADDVSAVTGTTTASAASASASAAPGKTGAGKTAGKAKHPRLRRLAIRRLALRGHVEHGQVTVETKTGDKIIDVQRGTVTAITSTTVTVKSTDGYTQTWSLSGSPTIIERRTTGQVSSIVAGTTVGIAGPQAGTTATAKLIVVPVKKPAPAASAS
jgi:hypothetical protein